MREDPTRSDSSVAVECYAGYKGEQGPQRFLFAERWLEIEEVLKMWREPAADFFRVRASDKRLYVLKRGVGVGSSEWSIKSVDWSERTGFST